MIAIENKAIKNIVSTIMEIVFMKMTQRQVKTFDVNHPIIFRSNLLTCLCTCCNEQLHIFQNSDAVGQSVEFAYEQKTCPKNNENKIHLSKLIFNN